MGLILISVVVVCTALWFWSPGGVAAQPYFTLLGYVVFTLICLFFGDAFYICWATTGWSEHMSLLLEKTYSLVGTHYN